MTVGNKRKIADFKEATNKSLREAFGYGGVSRVGHSVNVGQDELSITLQIKPKLGVEAGLTSTIAMTGGRLRQGNTLLLGHGYVDGSNFSTLPRVTRTHSKLFKTMYHAH